VSAWRGDAGSPPEAKEALEPAGEFLRAVTGGAERAGSARRRR